MADKPIRLFTDNDIAFLELANPPGNIINNAFFECFYTLKKSINDLKVKGMIVYSSGRHFSSGADVDELKTLMRQTPQATALALLSNNHDGFEMLTRKTFPVVAAIAGCCLGAGLEFALACRYRVAACRAVFALPESTFGLMPGCGGTIRLPALTGKGKAIEILLSGRIVPAEEAKEIGLVDIITNKKALLSTAIRLVDKINK